MTPAATVARLQQAENIFSVPVRYDPKRPGVAWACGVWPWKSIVVGMAWFGLTPAEQQAALWHELGHCRLWHMEQRIAIVLFAYFKWAQKLARRHEFEADAFAVAHGHGFGMLRIIHRSMRSEWAFRERVGPPTIDEVIERLLSPTPEDRAHNVLRLAQESRHEELAA